MKLTTIALIAAGGYYLYKKSKQPTVSMLPVTPVAAAPSIDATQAPVATLSSNPVPRLRPVMSTSRSPIATAVAPVTETYGSLGGTCFSSKRGMGIF